MPLRFEIRSHYIHVHWHGLVRPTDLGELFKRLPEVARECGFPPHVLHTAAPDATMLLGTWNAVEYSERRARTPIPVPVKVAFVADTPVAGALARGFRAFNANSSISMEVFPTEAEALAWLQAPSSVVPADERV